MTTPEAATPLIRHSHRHCYPPFHAPSLTCHVMLRFRRDMISDDIPSEDTSDDSRRDKVQSRLDEAFAGRLKPINKFLRLTTDNTAAFFESKSDAPASIPRRGKGIPPPPAAPRGCHHGATLYFKANTFGCFAIGVIAEVNAEYAALSFRAWPLNSDSSAVTQKTVAQTQDAYDDFRALCQGDLIPDSVADKASRALYGDFWDSYFCHLAQHDGKNVAARTTLFDEIGELSGEFQGLILATAFSEDEPEKEVGARKQEDIQTFEKFLKQSERNIEAADQYDGEGPLLQFNQADIDNIKARLRYFINDRQSFLSRVVGFRNRENGPFNPGNSVLGYVFDGLAIHGSTLGGDDERVTRYYVVYGGPSRHQLGRLAMCLHHCGEMRLAGFYDWDNLDVASHRIRMLDQAAGGFEHNATAKDRKAYLTRMRECRVELDSIAKSCRGGLAFRVSRSAYYAEVTDRLLKDLRVRRIEGWQTYEGFVRRNILRHVNGLAAIGERFEALQRRVRQIDNANTTLHLDGQQARLLRLQEAADWFAIVAVAYYGGTIAGYALYYAHALGAHQLIGDICTIVHAKCTASEDVSGGDAAGAQRGVANLIGFAALFTVAGLHRLWRWIRHRE